MTGNSNIFTNFVDFPLIADDLVKLIMNEDNWYGGTAIPTFNILSLSKAHMDMWGIDLLLMDRVKHALEEEHNLWIDTKTQIAHFLPDEYVYQLKEIDQLSLCTDKYKKQEPSRSLINIKQKIISSEQLGGDRDKTNLQSIRIIPHDVLSKVLEKNPNQHILIIDAYHEYSTNKYDKYANLVFAFTGTPIPGIISNEHMSNFWSRLQTNAYAEHNRAKSVDKVINDRECWRIWQYYSPNIYTVDNPLHGSKRVIFMSYNLFNRYDTDFWVRLLAQYMISENEGDVGKFGRENVLIINLQLDQIPIQDNKSTTLWDKNQRRQNRKLYFKRFAAFFIKFVNILKNNKMTIEIFWTIDPWYKNSLMGLRRDLFEEYLHCVRIGIPYANRFYDDTGNEEGSTKPTFIASSCLLQAKGKMSQFTDTLIGTFANSLLSKEVFTSQFYNLAGSCVKRYDNCVPIYKLAFREF